MRTAGLLLALTLVLAALLGFVVLVALGIHQELGATQPPPLP